MRGIFSLLTITGAVLWARVEAHHGYSLNYDRDQIGSVEGVVEEVFWSNPHVQYYLSVEDEEGSTATWIVETHNLRLLRDEGWTRDTIQAGDEIRVSGYAGRDGKPRIAGMQFELEDGTTHSLFDEVDDASE